MNPVREFNNMFPQPIRLSFEEITIFHTRMINAVLARPTEKIKYQDKALSSKNAVSAKMKRLQENPTLNSSPDHK